MPRFLNHLIAAIAFAVFANTATGQAPDWASPAVPAETISTTDIDKEVILSGTVISTRASSSPTAPNSITIAQSAAGSVQIVFWPEAEAEILGGKALPPAGTKVWVRGQLGEHRGNLQVRVREGGDIFIAGHDSQVPAAASPPSVPPPASPGYLEPGQIPLLRGMIGEMAAVTGQIAEFKPSWAEKAPSIVYLRHNSDELEVVFWAEPGTDMPRFEPGSAVYARGEVQDYRGRLQLKIDNPTKDIGLSPLETALAPPPDSSGEKVPQPAAEGGYYTVAQAPQLMPFLGQKISVTGKVSNWRAAWSETAPNIITLRGGGQEMEVVFWPVDGVDTPDFSQKGTTVYATGEIQDYRGRLQVKVNNLTDVSNKPLPADKVARPRVKGPAPKDVSEGWPGAKAPTAPPAIELEPGTEVRLRNIAPQHAGNVVLVRGNVKHTARSTDGAYIILADPLGFIRVNLPSEEAAKLQPGQKAALHGKVVYSSLRSATELEFVEWNVETE